METKYNYRVVDTETGNYCIYDGYFLESAFEAIKDNAKVDNELAGDFEDAELFDLYDGEERIWCGKTDTIEELCDICYPNPVLGKAVNDYMSAMFNWGSDPMLVEDIDSAIYIFMMMNEDDVIINPLSGEDLELAWEQLDLIEEKPTKVYSCGKYNQEKWKLCFEEDYL